MAVRPPVSDNIVNISSASSTVPFFGRLRDVANTQINRHDTNVYLVLSNGRTDSRVDRLTTILPCWETLVPFTRKFRELLIGAQNIVAGDNGPIVWNQNISKPYEERSETALQFYANIGEWCIQQLQDIYHPYGIQRSNNDRNSVSFVFASDDPDARPIEEVLIISVLTEDMLLDAMERGIRDGVLNVSKHLKYDFRLLFDADSQYSRDKLKDAPGYVEPPSEPRPFPGMSAQITPASSLFATSVPLLQITEAPANTYLEDLAGEPVPDWEIVSGVITVQPMLRPIQPERARHQSSHLQGTGEIWQSTQIQLLAPDHSLTIQNVWKPFQRWTEQAWEYFKALFDPTTLAFPSSTKARYFYRHFLHTGVPLEPVPRNT